MIQHDINFDLNNLSNYLSKLDKSYKISLIYLIIKDIFSTKGLQSKLDLSNYKHLDLMLDFLIKNEISDSSLDLISKLSPNDSLINKSLLLLTKEDLNTEVIELIINIFNLLDSLVGVSMVIIKIKKNQIFNIIKSIASITTSEKVDENSISFILDYIDKNYNNEIFIKNASYWHIDLPEYIIFPGHTSLSKLENDIINNQNPFNVYVRKYIKRIYS